MRSMGPVEVVEVFPDLELLAEVYVVSVVQQLIELLLVRSMRPFDLTVQLGGEQCDISNELKHVTFLKRFDSPYGIPCNGFRGFSFPGTSKVHLRQQSLILNQSNPTTLFHN